MEYNLVFIDDNMRDKEQNAFVRAIQKFNPDAKIYVTANPEEGLKYVMEHINSRIIAFVDCKFDGYSMQGITILRSIREQTSLLDIVMMSANSLNQIAGADVAEMINEDAIWFFDRNNGTAQDASDLISKIKSRWISRFDCILELWLVKHPELNEKIAYRVASTGKALTWGMVLIELRHQTEIGKSFEEMMHQFYIYHLENSSPK